MMKKSKLICVLTLGCMAVMPATADIVTYPTNLNVGDQYRLVFVTSGTRDATNQDIGAYNDFVTLAATNVAALNALGTTWKVIGSAGNRGSGVYTNADVNTLTRTTDTNAPIYRLDGVLVATNNADLWDGAISNGISITETGGIAGASSSWYVWTGATTNGGRASDWFLGDTGGGNVYYGIPTASNSTWVSNLGENKTTAHRFYAMSGTLTAPPKNCDILTFIWGSYTGRISGLDITLNVPQDTVVTNLNPICTVSPGATVLPASGSTNNFASTVDYTVTAWDRVTMKTYHVTVPKPGTVITVR